MNRARLLPARAQGPTWLIQLLQIPQRGGHADACDPIGLEPRK